VTWTEEGTTGAVKLLHEDGTPVAPSEISAGRHWAGRLHCQHSGSEECVMRYDVADALICVLIACSNAEGGGSKTPPVKTRLPPPLVWKRSSGSAGFGSRATRESAG
jgi:hypothetical protein